MEPTAKRSSLDNAEKASTHVASAAEMQLDPAVIKILKFKADFILLPVLTIAYLLK